MFPVASMLEYPHRFYCPSAGDYFIRNLKRFVGHNKSVLIYVTDNFDEMLNLATFFSPEL